MYEHGGDVYGNLHIRLDYSVNTNPLGMPEAVKYTLLTHLEEFSRYPDPECRQLRAAISKNERLPAEWILCGNGAADIIYRLCYAVKPKDALVCAPTFSEYERALRQAGCSMEYFHLRPDNDFALTETFLSDIHPATNLIFLCQPNNPNGRLINPNLLREIVQKAYRQNTLVAVDACFLDFAVGNSEEPVVTSLRDLLVEYSNLIVIKAFTKTYAMAGLRLGYAITSDRALLENMSMTSQCWSVSVPAQLAGVAALQDKDWLKKTQNLVREERIFLGERLRKMNCRVFSSDANFLLFQSEIPLYEKMLEKNILIRRCENFIGLDESFYRIGIKTRCENEEFLKALEEISQDREREKTGH